MEKITKSVLTVELILVCAACVYFFCTKSYSLSGKIIDANSGQAIGKNIELVYNNQTIKPDEKGNFTINQYNPSRNKTIQINDQQSFTPLNFEVGRKKYVEISINHGSEIFLQDFARNLKLNLFRKNYESVDDGLKSKISEEDYLSQANGWQLKSKKLGLNLADVSYEIAQTNSYYSKLLAKNYNNVLTVNFIYKFVDGNKTENQKRPTYFVQTNNGWRWLYDQDFFK